MTGELRPLTSARGLAAWLVVLYHIRLSIAGLPPPALAVFAKGYLAVDFFFLLSGFVIWLSWSERLRGGGAVAVRHFWWKRLARVWPLHLFMLAAAVALALLLLATGRANPARFPFAELPLHLLLIQNWGFTRVLTWNDPAWSISAEAAAYLLFPLLAAGLDWRRMPGVVVVAGIAAPLLLLHVVMSHAGAPTLGWAIPRLGLIRCLCELAGGTGVAALYMRRHARPRLTAALAAALATILLAGAAMRLLPETLAVPPAFAAVLLALALTARAARNPLGWAPLHYLGRISYATYLGHWLLFYAFKLALVSDARAVPPALVALYLVLVLATSVGLHHLVELPAQRWLGRRPLPARNDPHPRALPPDGRENRLFG